jgi:hypothetical protein
MASLDLRFIYWGRGPWTPVGARTAVITYIFCNIRSTLPLAYSTTPCSSWPCLFPSSIIPLVPFAMDTQWCLTCNRHLVRLSPYPSQLPSPSCTLTRPSCV